MDSTKRKKNKRRALINLSEIVENFANKTESEVDKDPSMKPFKPIFSNFSSQFDNFLEKLSEWDTTQQPPKNFVSLSEPQYHNKLRNFCLLLQKLGNQIEKVILFIIFFFVGWKRFIHFFLFFFFPKKKKELSDEDFYKEVNAVVARTIDRIDHIRNWLYSELILDYIRNWF